jgi:hypothetical protein
MGWVGALTSLLVIDMMQSHGRVMLDPLMYDKVCPDHSLIPSIGRSIKRKDLTVDHKLILTSVLYGFSLGDKTWGES